MHFFSFGLLEEDKIISKDEFHIPTRAVRLTLVSESTIKQSVQQLCSEATERFEDISLRGSGWVLVGLKYLDLSLIHI